MILVPVILWISVTLIEESSSVSHLSLPEFIADERIYSVPVEAVDDVLREPWLPQSSVAFVSDRPIHPGNIYQLSDIFQDDLTIAVFETTLNDLQVIGNSKSKLILQLQMMHGTSKNLMLVVVSDNVDFLISFLDVSYHSDLLLWPKRVLIVTKISPLGLQGLKEIFSNTNGMIITHKEDSQAKRCDVHVFLPYSLRLLLVARWSQTKKFQYMTDYRLFPNKFDRFIDETHLKVVDEHFPPYVSVKLLPGVRENGDPNFTIEGPMMKQIQLLSQNMNFTFSLFRPPDGSWGYVQPNLSANGMVGMLGRKEVDIALGPFAVTLNRAQVMDYTLTIINDALAMIAGVGSTEIDVWAFALPLTYPVWAAILASFIAIVVVAKSLSILIGAPLENSFIIYVEVLFQEAAILLKCDSWERFLLGSWTLTTAILMFSYCGNLMSLLAVRYIPQPYQSLAAVLEDPQITMIWEANTAYVFIFREATSGELLRVKQMDDRNEIQYVLTSQFNRKLDSVVAEGRHVLIAEEITLKLLMADQFTSTGTCRFYISKGTFIPNSFAFAVQKRSPLRPAINKRIVSLIEGGIYTHWLQTELRNSTTCLNAPTKVLVQTVLSIGNLWGIFMILVVGDVISGAVFLIEILQKRCKTTET